ncbi:MAG: hypothetical protein K6U74_08535 [Firmicutes bacterium]|nr:hypothetical protein [Bacillota bacterium]
MRQEKEKKENKLKSAAKIIVIVFVLFCIKLPIEFIKILVAQLETAFYYFSALAILALVYVVVGYAAAQHGVDLPLHQATVKIIEGFAALLRDKLHIPAAG